MGFKTTDWFAFVKFAIKDEFYAMVFKKFKGEQFFDGYRMRGSEMVLITREDGTIEDLVDVVDAGDEVQQLPGLLSPGFINCHVHLELSHMRERIPEGTGLVNFVKQVVTQRHAPEEEILLAIEKAEDEMVNNGIVAAGDICNNAMSIRQKLKGRIWYHNFVEASGFDPRIAEERFQRSLAFYSAYAKMYSIPAASNSITPHAPYSVADELWEKIIHFPGNHLFSIHNQETAEEDEWFLTASGNMKELYKGLNMDYSFFKAKGRSSLQYFLPKFLNNQTVILVHNVFTSSEDVRYAQETRKNLFWCLCPNANQYISNRLPEIDLLLKEGCQIVLGTDSLASNKQLSILSEIMTIQKQYPTIELETVLQWATSNGAKALQLVSLMGSFEKNKKPGVLLINNEMTAVKRLL